MKFLNSQRGVSLYYAIIIMSVSLSIALGINAISVKSLRTTREIKKSPPALYGADTGIEEALYDIKKKNAGIGSSTESYLSWDGEQQVKYDYKIASSSASFCPDDSMYCIHSTGEYQGSARTLKVVR